MGSSFKSSNNHSHSYKGKPYALMLLLAFGAAILGVMVLHKLREKRIFNHLVKENEHQLLTLHLLFQREKELNKEARKKIEEMKTKVFSLRTQKLELDRKLLEMESTILSLRDERKVIESALEEKKNEIKMLTQESAMMMNSTVEPHQVVSLKETINMKETETRDHLEKPLNDIGLHQHGYPISISTSNSTKDERSSTSQSEENKSEKLNDDKQEDLKKQNSENITVEVQSNHGNLTSHKLEKREGPNDLEHGLGLRVRSRKHSKGKKWREMLRNRKLIINRLNSRASDGDQLTQHSVDQQNHTSERVTDQLVSEKGKQENDSNENVGSEDNTEKQKSDEIISKQSEEHEKKEQTQGSDSEQQKEGEKEEVGDEDSEVDAETHEPEIDRADIQRFSESDHDEEAEEAEF